MVTNPATRDWTVTASTFATLNEMFGNRTVVGIGRGDSAVRVINGKPVTLAELRESIGVIRDLANGRADDVQGQPASSSPGTPTAGSTSTSPPTDPRRSRSPARWATASSSSSPTCRSRSGASPRCDAQRRRPGATRCRSRSASRRRRTSATTSRTSATRCGGSAAWSATTSPTSSSATAHDGAAVPPELTDYIRHRQGYDYNEHGRAGNTHTDFVPDEIVDRFCVLGPAQAHIDKLIALQDARRRPVRRLPAARRQRGDPGGLRRHGHPRPAPARRRPGLTRRDRSGTRDVSRSAACATCGCGGARWVTTCSPSATA